MCPSSPGSSVTGRDWSPRPPVSPAWALSSACAPAGRICAHRQGFQRQGARLGRGEDLGRRICPGCGQRPAALERGPANTPRCFHSGGMWQVWARVPQPSRGHER